MVVAHWALFYPETAKSLRRKMDRLGSRKAPSMPISTYLSYMACHAHSFATPP